MRGKRTQRWRPLAWSAGFSSVSMYDLLNVFIRQLVRINVIGGARFYQPAPIALCRRAEKSNLSCCSPDAIRETLRGVIVFPRYVRRRQSSRRFTKFPYQGCRVVAFSQQVPVPAVARQIVALLPLEIRASRTRQSACSMSLRTPDGSGRRCRSPFAAEWRSSGRDVNTRQKLCRQCRREALSSVDGARNASKDKCRRGAHPVTSVGLRAGARCHQVLEVPAPRTWDLKRVVNVGSFQHAPAGVKIIAVMQRRFIFSTASAVPRSASKRCHRQRHVAGCGESYISPTR